MTDRLYYSDPYLRAFDARIIETLRIDDRAAVVLDRTAFYPTSGGQPFDTGMLGPTRVVSVIDLDDGRVAHVVEAEPPDPEVHGTIDWTRRFDHMQQHTGQHVLSAAFDRLHGVRTESFHLGGDASAIDLARELSAAEIASAEQEANRIVWEDRPVTIRFATAEEAARLPLRKDSLREGTLRLIDIENFDLSACGGTHVARTGAIGIITVAATERFRGGSRVTFLCGGRALHGYHGLRDAVAASIRHLSVLPSELPAAIERLQTEAKSHRRLIKDLQSRVALQEADALADAAPDLGGVRFVAAALADWDANHLKIIAARIASRSGHVAVLMTGSGTYQIVVACGGDAAVDSGAILKALVAQYGGKGGGRSDLAQGGGLSGDSAEILKRARDLVADSRGGRQSG